MEFFSIADLPLFRSTSFFVGAGKDGPSNRINAAACLVLNSALALVGGKSVLGGGPSSKKAVFGTIHVVVRVRIQHC